MKNSFFITLLCAFISVATYAQSESGYGVKAGLNYNANGNYFESIDANAQKPDGNIGYHLGVFAKFGSHLYFKPELVYTSTKSDYASSSFKMQKLDAPLLVGMKVFGPISVFGLTVLAVYFRYRF